jgi:hypothetical protein
MDQDGKKDWKKLRCFQEFFTGNYGRWFSGQKLSELVSDTKMGNLFGTM